VVFNEDKISLSAKSCLNIYCLSW